MKFGIVTNVKKDKDVGILIDILGFDGSFYKDVALMNPPGSNEVPVPSDISYSLTAIDDPVLREIVSPHFDPRQVFETAKFRTFVLYETIDVEKGKHFVIPVKFYKNWAQETGSLPAFRIEPDPGEVVIQASGTPRMPGGYLYLDKNGNVKMSTAFATSTLFLENETGKATFRFNEFLGTGCGFSIHFDKGALVLTKKKYVPNIGYAPLQTHSIVIDNEKVEIKVSPQDVTVPTITVTVKETGEITIKGTSFRLETIGGNIKFTEAGVLQINDKNDPVITLNELARFMADVLSKLVESSKGPVITGEAAMTVAALLLAGVFTGYGDQRVLAGKV